MPLPMLRSDTDIPAGASGLALSKLQFANCRGAGRLGRKFPCSMVYPTGFVRLLVALAIATACLATARAVLPPEPVRLESLAGFRTSGTNWTIGGGLAGDPRREKQIRLTPGTGVLGCAPGKTPDTKAHLFTDWDHGDLELDVEFLLTPGSNSGLYLQGRYEVQLFDSWGVREPTSGDGGGIYLRWDAARGPGREGYDGHAPRANACRAPGLWQTLHIGFEAPRFDATGQKTRNARFTKVVLNGYTIHENVEVTGPTRSSAFNDEKPTGPLMIQGDHGPVAFRRLAVKRFGPEPLIAQDLRYQLFAGDFRQVGQYGEKKPQSEGTPERFAHSAIEKSGRFALVFTGTLRVPRAGTYQFEVESSGPARLQIGGRTVVAPLDRGSQPGTIELPAGSHPFRLDVIHNSNARPALEVIAEGPGIARGPLTVRERGPRPAAGRGKPVLVEPTDRILLQRSFVPFEPRKRLYAASVGTPAGVHYAYDFETGAVLRAWRGAFINTSEMWEGRGTDQVAQPTGPALTFIGKPAIALIEYAQRNDWPDQPDALWSSNGYTLEPNGQPVFLAQLAELSIRDRVAPASDGRGLTRRLELDGRLPSWSTWVLLAEASTITPQPGGHGWIIGERDWYLDWPTHAARTPVVRTVGSKQQLALPLTPAALADPITYSIIW